MSKKVNYDKFEFGKHFDHCNDLIDGIKKLVVKMNIFLMILI